jgi:hypothetical protein
MSPSTIIPGSHGLTSCLTRRRKALSHS